MGDYCKNCGAYLPDQTGYSEDAMSHMCTECGTVNGETDIEIPGKGEEKKNSFLRKHWKKIAVAVIAAAVVIAAVCGITKGISTVKKLQRTGISSEECIGLSFEEVRQKFEAEGFTDVTVKPLADLNADELENEGFTASVAINGKDSFRKTKLARSDAPVVISYHSAVILKAPEASRNVKNMTYKALEKEFKDAGFVNVTTKALYGTWGKEGRVLSVTVDGDKKWTEGDEYRVDAEVSIVYRTRN